MTHNTKRQKLDNENFNPEPHVDKTDPVDTNVMDPYNNKYLSDFKIISKDGKIFYVSKLIIASVSPWFGSFFKDSHETEITIDYDSHDIKPWLQTFHDYCCDDGKYYIKRTDDSTH
jgi:hypothetical protein